MGTQCFNHESVIENSGHVVKWFGSRGFAGSVYTQDMHLRALCMSAYAAIARKQSLH